jgi:type I restriction enzyme S subunit
MIDDLTQMDYPRYDSYKDSGVDWLGEIPEGWDTKRLKYVLSERNERSKTGDEPLLMVSQKYGLVIRADYHAKATVALSSVDNKIVYKNDLVFNKLKAHLGVFYKSEIDLKGIVSPDYAVYKSKAYVEDLKFLELLFKLPTYIQQFIIRSTGVAEGLIRLYTSELFDLPIPIPPLSEQKKILEFIENEFVQIDQAIHLKQQQITKLEEYKQIVIQNAVTKGLNPDAPMKDSGVDWIGNIPTHWEVKKLKFISRINNSTLPEKTDSKLEIKYVDIGSVTFEEGVVRTEAFDFGNAPSRARRIAKNHDTIISTVRTYLKAIDYIDNEKSNYIYSTGFAVLTPNQQIKPKFLTSFVWSNAFTNQVRDFSKGVSYPAINSSDLGNLFISLPPHEEQKEIIEYINSKSRQINSSINNIKLGIDRLKEYKTILINQAVTGKIKVV